MPFEIERHDDEPVGGGRGVKVTDLGSEHRLISHGVEQLAHGALVCPSCDAPVRPPLPAIGVGSALACGFCATEAPARDYLVTDVYDTAGNEVAVIARLGRSR